MIKCLNMKHEINNNYNKNRQSNFELLRIVLMFGIVCGHYLSGVTNNDASRHGFDIVLFTFGGYGNAAFF